MYIICVYIYYIYTFRAVFISEEHWNHGDIPGWDIMGEKSTNQFCTELNL